MPFGGDRATVTVDPGARALAADVLAASPRAVSASLDQLFIVPEGSLGFVTCGDDDGRAYAGRPPAGLERARALFVNQREALLLTGESTIEDAGARLALLADTAIVTLAGEGASRSVADYRHVRARPVADPVETTGAGYLLTAAYIWADLRGAEQAEKLRWAVLYATLAVRPYRDRRRGERSGAGAPVTTLDLVPPPLAGTYAR